jgi:hypothetical protein
MKEICLSLKSRKSSHVAKDFFIDAIQFDLKLEFGGTEK